MSSGAGSPARLEVPESLVAFFSTSTAAGNKSATVAVKGRSCLVCGHDSLSFGVEQTATVMSGRTPRRQFHVVARCGTPSCGFLANTNGRFTLG
jgi:hypothetical protein